MARGTVVLEQGDMFGAPVRTLVAAPRPTPAPKPRASRMARTSLEAGSAKSKESKVTDEQRCLHDIKAAGTFGRTRNELSARLGIPIQSVCWAVAGLLAPESGPPEVCEPILEHEPKPRHLTRERSKVLVAVLYRAKYERPAQGISARIAGGE